MTEFVQRGLAEDHAKQFVDGTISLVLTDPPFHGIVSEDWDNQWNSPGHFATWLSEILFSYEKKLTPTGSIVFFAGIGKHGIHPLFQVIGELEARYTFRNWITWKKRRAYGKSHDYLYCREEILWFSKSNVRTEVTFNIPLTDELRGYDGFGKHKAKSDYKRVSNVFGEDFYAAEDIPEGYYPNAGIIEEPELFKPSRQCEKPVPLMERLVRTHSNPGDLVVDMFAGTGSSGVAAFNLGRDFRGCEKDHETAAISNGRVMGAYQSLCARTPR